MKNERNIYIDVVKGIAIILVVYGHCIEYYSKEYIYDNFLTMSYQLCQRLTQ